MDMQNMINTIRLIGTINPDVNFLQAELFKEIWK